MDWIWIQFDTSKNLRELEAIDEGLRLSNVYPVDSHSMKTIGTGKNK
jgi:hypothetical protein